MTELTEDDWEVLEQKQKVTIKLEAGWIEREIGPAVDWQGVPPARWTEKVTDQL